MNNKKGYGPLISVLLMLLILIGIFIVYFVFSLTAPPILSAFNETVFTLQDASKSDNDLGNATANTFVPVNAGLDNLRWISYSLLVITLLGFLFCAYTVRTYPFFAVIWILGMIVLIFVSIYMASAYQDVAGNDELGMIYQSWTTNDYFMRYMPYIITAFGFIGGFILFAIISRESEVEF